MVMARGGREGREARDEEGDTAEAPKDRSATLALFTLRRIDPTHHCSTSMHEAARARPQDNVSRMQR